MITAKGKEREKIITWVAYMIVAIFVATFSFLSFQRHDSLKSYLNDLGTYDQIVWNSSQGRLFDNSANMLGQRNYLGAHFSPILLFFVPFYFIVASAKWMLFFQALSVGMSLIPVYLLAKEKLKKSFLALLFMLSAALNPALHNGVLYDFHEVVLATGFAAWAFYFLEKGQDRGFIIMAILLSLSQEHLPLLVFMLGLYAAVIKKKKKLGLVVSLSALAYFFLVMQLLIPHFSSSGTPALIDNNSPYLPRYAWLGSNLKEIIQNIFMNPLSILVMLLSADRIYYLFMLILPVFSLAIYAWPITIILPMLMINLLSGNSMTFNIYFYYSAIMVPFIYFSCVDTFKRWFLSDRKIASATMALIVVVSIWSALHQSVWPLSTLSSYEDFLPSAHAKRVNEIKKLIPSGASLSVQHNLGPHFSQRKELYRFPLAKETADYILLDSFNPYDVRKKQVFSFEYALQMDVPIWESEFKQLKESEKFETLYSEDGYLLLKRK